MVWVAVTWLVLVLALPLASVFAGAFSQGVRAFAEALARPEVLHAAWLTIVAVLVALVVNTAFGLAAGWTVARTNLPGRGLIRVLVDVPVAVPPVIAGLMILLLYGRGGWFEPLLERMGVDVVFALPAILIATTFVTLPFVAKEVISVLEESGRDEEEAALMLGASRVQCFLHVVLPNLRWALFYGLVLTAARALGEFGAVAVVSGNLIGQTQTLPLYIERAYANYETVAAFSAAVPLTLVAVLTLVLRGALIRRRVRADAVVNAVPAVDDQTIHTQGGMSWT